MRRVPVLLIVIAVVSVALRAQTSANPSLQTPSPPLSPPSFEVASIKRNINGTQIMRGGFYPGGRLVLVNAPLGALITFGYPSADVRELDASEEWLASDRYDVNAKAPTDNPTQDEMHEMARTLLRDRLKLVAHYETRQQPVYALVLARSDGRLGPEMRRTTVDCAAIAAANRERRPLDVPRPANGAPPCSQRVQDGVWILNGLPVAAIAMLSDVAGRSIVDKTGLTGPYDMMLTLESQDPGSSLFTAMQEQLGLRLQPERIPQEALVIDHVERPTEN